MSDQLILQQVYKRRRWRNSTPYSSVDPDAAAWFDAVEATGATFGPDSATADANKKAWDTWVKAQKNAESPIAGRSNWDQLTQEDEGFIQPLIGLSTFDVPALFGGRTFTGFVADDYDPAMGLKGGAGKVLSTNRLSTSAPINDSSLGMWVTAAGGEVENSLIAFCSDRFRVTETATFRNRTTTNRTFAPSYGLGTFPRSCFMSRDNESTANFHNSTLYSLAESSLGTLVNELAFFNRDSLEQPSTVRGGVAFYGRAINLTAMNTACIALSEAITWP